MEKILPLFFVFIKGIFINISIIVEKKKQPTLIYKVGIIPLKANNAPPRTGPIKPASELTRLIIALADIIFSLLTRTGILA